MSDNSIIFPNLHITLESVGQSVSVFGFSIAFYGIVIALGMILAGVFMIQEAKKIGMNDDALLDVIICGILCGVVGARIYYVVFSWDSYKDDLLQIFNLRAGGLAIYGGIIGGAIGVILSCRWKKLRFFEVADLSAFGILIGQIMGRWGNFFNREAFGDYTDGLFAMLLPVNAVRSQSYLTEAMLQNTVIYDGVEFVSVHPTFLYESLWNLGIFIGLLIYRKHKKFQGELFFWYLMLYAAGRFWIESLRTDQLILGDTGIPVSQLLAFLIVLCAGAYLLVRYVKLIRDRRSSVHKE